MSKGASARIETPSLAVRLLPRAPVCRWSYVLKIFERFYFAETLRFYLAVFAVLLWFTAKDARVSQSAQSKRHHYPAACSLVDSRFTI